LSADPELRTQDVFDLPRASADLAATRHAREQRDSSRELVDTGPQAGRLQRREK